MMDSPFYTPNRKIVDPIKAKPREKLFELLVGHDRWLCELVDLGKGGIDVQWFQNEEFHHSRRFDHSEHDSKLARDLAVAWATDERSDLEANRGGR
ncbi:MAG TPA: hypothetical protein VFA59_18010 [Vicinamibacterales bacterium]|nr:hypothetical protein [Vicinamibacterales bacterium]